MRSRLSTHEEQLRTAVHEASHVIVAVVLRRPFYNVTIVPTPALDGSVSVPALYVRGHKARDARNEIVILLAGWVGEVLVFGSRGFAFPEYDLVKACMWIRRSGFRWTLTECFRLTTKLVKKHWSDVVKLAGVLLDEKTMSAREVRRVLAK